MKVKATVHLYLTDKKPVRVYAEVVLNTPEHKVYKQYITKQDSVKTSTFYKNTGICLDISPNSKRAVKDLKESFIELFNEEPLTWGDIDKYYESTTTPTVSEYIGCYDIMIPITIDNSDTKDVIITIGESDTIDTIDTTDTTNTTTTAQPQLQSEPHPQSQSPQQPLEYDLNFRLPLAKIYLMVGESYNLVVAFIDEYAYYAHTNGKGDFYGIPIYEYMNRKIPDIIRDLQVTFSYGLTYESFTEIFVPTVPNFEGKFYKITDCNIY